MTDKLFIPAPAGARLDIYEWPVDVIEETPSTISYPLLGWTHRTMSHSTSPDSGTPVFLRGASSMEYEPGGSQTARAVLPGDDPDDQSGHPTNSPTHCKNTPPTNRNIQEKLS